MVFDLLLAERVCVHDKGTDEVLHPSLLNSLIVTTVCCIL